MNRLHNYTYPELQDSKVPIVDWTGTLWCGPDRRSLNAPNPVDLWRAWQKDIQRAEKVSPRVMQYFQASKHFDRPPKKGDEEMIVEAMERIGVKKEIVQAVKDVVKPDISWSFSQINQFETCPYQWASERFYKTTPSQETEATQWGSRVHKQLEDYINSCGVTETPEMGLKWAQALVAAKRKGYEVICELQMALDRKLKPVEWYAGWGRGVADVVVIKDGIARIWDWKTGKKKEDMTQLLIFCAFLAQHRPDVKEFQAEFVWLKDDEKVGMKAPVTRQGLLNVWKDILSRVKRMEEAVEEEIFTKNKSGLCGKWCGVMDCPNNGRR